MQTAVARILARSLRPIISRLAPRAEWWQLGVPRWRSASPVYALSVGGRAIDLRFPDGEFELQQNELHHLFIDDPYGLKTLPRDKIKTVLDIGANIGLFALLARYYFPTACIHSYEPNGALAPLLMNNTRAANIAVFMQGIGLQRGRAEIHFDFDGQVYPSLVGMLRPEENGPIEICSIRDAIDRFGQTVDLVKLDCEGDEWKILEDVDSLRRINFLAMEYHLNYATGQTVETLIGHLRHNGFVIDSLKEADIRTVGTITAHRL
jgi:FkbM family methyltransferase